ncbi:helix-turn-helix domain-containing protein [Mycolicibacterium sp.]|uniref:helix-turn-helix domain-containing protein n=1 Tax=Mycolicibacterium sp. TaxID=2320850 RepID=UPI00345575AB
MRVEGRVILGGHMPRQYSSSVRRQIVARLRSGEPVAVVAAETGICQATLSRWKRRALIGAGVIEGTLSVEAGELPAVHKCIAALEAQRALNYPRFRSDPYRRIRNYAPSVFAGVPAACVAVVGHDDGVLGNFGVRGHQVRGQQTGCLGGVGAPVAA